MVVVRDAHPTQLNSSIAKLGGRYLLRVTLLFLNLWLFDLFL
jgi:hypothetical protein